jgi:predicted NBD/HSP70 family sugar kinase
VDLGATNVRVAISDADGNIEARRHVPTPSGPPEDVVRKIASAIDELARGVWVGARVDAIGIALPGMVDPGAGLVASVANIPGWNDVPLAALLGGERGIPVAMENDANAAAVGEGWLGAARGKRHHVFVAWGTGIGSGIVLNGELYRGAHGLAGEIAFFPVTRDHVRSGGWEENVEALAAGRAIRQKTFELFGAESRASDLFDAARSGQVEAALFVRDIQERVAMATAYVIAMLDPEVVVFGGGVIAAQGAWLLDPIIELAHRSTPLPTKIVMSELGEDAQILGAVKLALDKEGVVGPRT